MPVSTRPRLAALAGAIAPALFVATFTIEGWLRPGYDAIAMYVSALSLGPRGWIQILNFVVVGTLMLVFALEQRWRAGRILLAVIALGLIASGPFVMDPMNAPRAQMTPRGLAHQLLGAVVFSLMPVTCFVAWRRFRARAPRFALWSLAAAAIVFTALVLLKIAQLRFPAWLGLLERVAIDTFMLWLLTFALGSSLL
jgi:hypothetical protein